MTSSGFLGARGSSLTPDQTSALYEVLVAHVQTNLAQAAAHETVARELAAHTDADSIVERELAELCAAQAREVAREAERALARLAAGTYGSCDSCGGAIPIERLEALPHTRLCVTCRGRELSPPTWR